MEQHISIYGESMAVLDLLTGQGSFLNNQFSNPAAAERKCLRLLLAAADSLSVMQASQPPER
jgi:hypothetical protein